MKERLEAARTELSKMETYQQKLAVRLDVANAKLAEMKDSGRTTTDQIKYQRETVTSLGYLYDTATKNVNKMRNSVEKLEIKQSAAADKAERMARSVEDTNTELTATRERAAQVAREMAKGHPALDQVGKSAEKLENRLKRLASRVMFFSVFTAGLRLLRNWFADVIKTDKDAVAAIGQLQGALLTLVQPLVGMVIPAFTSFVRLLAQAVWAMASVVSSVFGSTVEKSAAAAESLNDEKKALDGVGASAKKAGKSLASFDEINRLGSDTSGTSSAATEIAPNFSFMDGNDEQLQDLANKVLLVGLGLLSWKISDGFLDGLSTFLGLLIAIKGATMAAKNIWDAWENGFTLSNLVGAVIGAIGVILGLQLAFGKVGGAVGLLVSGIMLLITAIKDIWENGLTLENGLAAVAGVLMTCWGIGKLVGATFGTIAAAAATVTIGIAALVLAFQDAIENGWNLENTLTAVTGVILTGLGISLLVGTWIPALVAGILSILLAIATLTGNGGELIANLKLVFSGLIEFITGVFTGDWGRAWNGAKEVFAGVWNSIIILLESALNFIIKGLNWLISKINTISFEVPDWVPSVGGKSIGFNIPPISYAQLPRLATGAVIPPNREFFAVLGDQKQGTNIEAPADLIRQMVAEGMRAGGGGGRQMTVILQLDRRELGRAVYTLNNEETQRVGVRLAGVRA